MSFFAIFAFVGVVVYAVRRNPKPPPIQSEKELSGLGYSAKEAKREASAQRNEQRTSTHTVLDGIKAGSQAARTIIKIGNKF